MDKVAVLIPCYNEAKTIEKVVKDFHAALPEAIIYVYDNNSTDDTASIAKAAGAIVRHEYMQGKGNVIRRMFRDIDAECYIMADGDDTYPAEFSGEMARLVLNRQSQIYQLVHIVYLHMQRHALLNLQKYMREARKLL